MELFFAIFTQAQKNALQATADLTDTYLVVVERVTQLNLEVARTAFEKSAELGQLCVERTLVKEPR